MKAVIILVILAVICATIAEAGVVPPVASLQKEQFEKAFLSGAGKPCKCMNGHNCLGEVNHEIQCSPSYLFVCCVIPELKNDQPNEVQVVHV